MRLILPFLSVVLLSPAMAQASRCDFLLWSQTIAEHNRAMPSDSVPLALDPSRLISDFSSRDLIARGLVANVVAGLGQFPDASLVHQILEHQRGDHWVFNASRLKIVGVDQALASAVHAWLSTLASLGPLDKSTWQKFASALNETAPSQYLNVTAQAVLLDASFAPFEGDDSMLEDLDKTGWLGLLRKRAIDRPADGRSTPFGVPTDDSQFLVSGAHAALADGSSSFVDTLLSDWTALNGESLWRNIGARFRSWLSQDQRAFQGPTMLGDFLRLSAILPRFLQSSDTHLADSDLNRLAHRLNWPSGKLEIARAFLLFQHARLNLDAARASEHFEHLIELTAAEDTKTADFLRIARATLWDKTDLRSYLKTITEVGRDFDTYGFLAPFFAPRVVINPNDFRYLGSNTRIFVATIIASTLAKSGTLPVDTALTVRQLYLDNERRLAKKLEILRHH